nr:hypothetical protein [uncultured Mediterranean phage uvMED]
MPGSQWNTRPGDYCAAARQRAIAALHAKHSKGLTALEKSFLQALKEGRITPTEDES